MSVTGFDDFEICNPLGTSRKKHKICAVYLNLSNYHQLAILHCLPFIWHYSVNTASTHLGNGRYISSTVVKIFLTIPLVEQCPSYSNAGGGNYFRTPKHSNMT